MSFFSRLFGKDDPKPCPPSPPDDTEMVEKLADAENKHKRAAVAVKGASVRQMTEGQYIRTTLNNVLRNIEERKND
jgi:hypothetical protein